MCKKYKYGIRMEKSKDIDPLNQEMLYNCIFGLLGGRYRVLILIIQIVMIMIPTPTLLILMCQFFMTLHLPSQLSE